MSDSQELSGNPGEMGETKKDGQVKKLTFTPPILHEYGEIVKICKQEKGQGQLDFFTNPS